MRKKLKIGKPAEKTIFLNIHYFNYNGINFKIAFVRKRANKSVSICCYKEKIAWKTGHYIVFRIIMNSVVICKPDQFIDKNYCNILVVSGKPNNIYGLDEGMLASAKKLSKNFDNRKLYVITKKEYKRLSEIFS